MHSFPYPPDWSRSNSPEILVIWKRFSRRCQLHGYLLLEGDEHQPWRITAITGTLALLLAVLLFLEMTQQEVSAVAPPVKPSEERSPTPVVFDEPQVGEVEQEPEVDTATELDPQDIDPAYPVEITQLNYEIPAQPAEPDPEKKPVPQPEPVDDPFVMFEPPKEEEKAEPTFDPFETAPPKEEPQPIEPEPVTSPELMLEGMKTDYEPIDGFSESVVENEADSRFTGEIPAETLVAQRWDTAERFRETLTPSRKRWTDNARETLIADLLTLASSDEAREEAKAETLRSGRLELKKLFPEQTSTSTTLQYQLELTNHGQETAPEVLVQERFSDMNLVEEVSPQATLHKDQMTWRFQDLKPGEKRTIEITCRVPVDVQTVDAESSLIANESLASVSQVIVPDVTVSVTVPVEVETGQEFTALVVVENNSEKEFQPSDLTVETLQNVSHEKGAVFVENISVPAPGEKHEMPVKLVSTGEGEGILEARLNLENSLTVPVKAYTTVFKRPRKSETEATAKKFSHDLVSLKPVMP